jgi:hypothetical protein
VPSNEEVQAAADEAVGTFLANLGSDLSTGRYVLLAEVMDISGEKMLWTVTPVGQKAWDSLGILEYALSHERRHLEDPDD